MILVDEDQFGGMCEEMDKLNEIIDELCEMMEESWIQCSPTPDFLMVAKSRIAYRKGDYLTSEEFLEEIRNRKDLDGGRFCGTMEKEEK